ncbi:MAG: hypothetical protein ACOYNL_04320 [Rickettsiales bacterium]
MTVSTIATIAAGLNRAYGNQNSKASSVFNSLISGSSRTTSGDVANLSAAINLQNQIAQFRVASKGVAQATAVLSTANAGAEEIGKQLARLRDIASRASAPNLSAEERAQLNIEFQAVRSTIDRIAGGTRFNNESLLDGSSQQLVVTNEDGEQKNLSIGSLTTQTLFKGTNPDVSTASGAKVAEATIKAAQDYAQTQLENIAALQEGLEFATSTLQSAIQNQDAANSFLDDIDFTTQLLTAGQNPVEAGGLSALFAQTKRLPQNILQLLSE